MADQQQNTVPQSQEKKSPRRIKVFLNLFKQRVFVAFLILAVLLWYFNRLGNRFTTEIDIPVHLVTDFNSEVWIDQPDLKVRCLVEGEGRRLVLYKFGLMPYFGIAASRLNFISAATDERPYRNMIEPRSMMRMLALGIKDLTFVQVTDSLLSVNVSPMGSARLPVYGNVRIEPDRQYMQVGTTIITPDTVMVKAPVIVLDSLRQIETESRHFTRARRSLNGSVGLRLPRSVISDVSSVRYSADVTSYTEVEYKLDVGVASLPAHMQATVVPMQVYLLLKVPLRSYNRYQSRSPVAEINFAEKDENLSSFFAVKIDSLPPGVEIISVHPEFVEAFFELPKY